MANASFFTPNLTPGAVAVTDYVTAQKPALGGESEVYLTTQPAVFLGKADLTADGVVAYRVENAPLKLTGTVTTTGSSTAFSGTSTKFLSELSVGMKVQLNDTTDETVEILTITSDTAATAGAISGSVYTANPAAHSGVPVYPLNPICAFVITELRAGVAADIDFAELGGAFTPAAWSRIQNFNFPATRGVELTGTLANFITTTTLPTIVNAIKGSKVGFVQLPQYSQFHLVGCTTSKDIDMPVRESKFISCGLETSRFNKPGKTIVGSLNVMARDLGEDDGLQRFKGLNCVAMVERQKEERVTTARMFCTNYVPGGRMTNPDADGEADINGTGTFQHMITLVAP